MGLDMTNVDLTAHSRCKMQQIMLGQLATGGLLSLSKGRRSKLYGFGCFVGDAERPVSVALGRAKTFQYPCKLHISLVLHGIASRRTSSFRFENMLTLRLRSQKSNRVEAFCFWLLL